jgi:hypothetical protein
MADERKASGKCHWWNRWWHRKLRKIDRREMMPALERAAARYGPAEHAQEVLEIAWEGFKRDKGQEHWRCECALEEECPN